jgi:hypothetical protein
LYVSPRLVRGKRNRHFHTPLGQAARAGALCIVVDDEVVSKAWEETEGTPRFFFGENIRSVPIDRAIHGICNLPVPGPRTPKYSLVEVPPHMPLQPYEAPDSDSDWHLPKNHNPPKLLISILQILWGIVTLYKTRGDQIASYGYGAFGLTVAPYAIMSIINLATNLVRPEYASMYLVYSPEMQAAINAGGEFKGMVAEVDDEAIDPVTGRTKPEAFTGGLDEQSIARNNLHNAFNMAGYLVTAILPIALVGGYTGFQSGSNIEIAVSWILGWLIVGSVSSLWVRIAGAYGGVLHPIWGVILVLPLWVPAIGGLVVVGQMLKDFGICTSFDK